MRRPTGLGIVLLLIPTAGVSAQVVLRGGERLDAAVEDVGIAALRMAPASTGGSSRLVSWDRVRAVEGEAASKAGNFASLMDQLWRARTRVERDDFSAAEPLLDELYQVYAGEEGPSAAVVAECMLRCRLARGAQGAATSSWLWWTGLMERRSGGSGGKGKQTPNADWVGGATDLRPVIDPATHLAPAIPPIWIPGAATQAAATATEWPVLEARGGVAGELATMYEKAARFEAGLDTEITLPAQVSNEPAVGIVRDIVLARAGDPEAREAARASIKKRLSLSAGRVESGKPPIPPMPTWMEAWLRMGLGQSMIRETDNGTRTRGVIELLHIPARFGAEQANLAGIALADAAVVMSELGDSDAAAVLKSELIARYPTHPVLSWEALAKISATPPVRNDTRAGAALFEWRIQRRTGEVAHSLACSPMGDRAGGSCLPSRDGNPMIQKGRA